MSSVNLLLSSSEWIRVRDAEGKQFPDETLFRCDICRRCVLAGIDATKNLSPADQARLVHQFQASMESSDKRLKH